jgi:hypothetical protein
MDVTPEDLHANYRKKSCQAGCGVYCAVSTSLLVQQPVSVISKEVINRAKRIPGMIKQSVAGNDEARMTKDEGMPKHERPEALV